MEKKFFSLTPTTLGYISIMRSKLLCSILQIYLVRHQMHLNISLSKFNKDCPNSKSDIEIITINLS